MALAILDGTQTATTLSTILSSGQHITAHTIVSLGTQSITDITGAVSGSVVTIPNLNVLARSVATDGIADGTLNFVKIGGHQDGSNQIGHIVHVSGGGAMKVDASDSTVTFGAIRGTVTIGNSVTIGSLPLIAGTVTANVLSLPDNATGFFGDGHNNLHTLFESGSLAVSPISGTVSLGIQQADDTDPNIKFLPIGFAQSDGGGQLDYWAGVKQTNPLPVYLPSTSSLPAGTNRIGVVTIGGGTVTIGAGTAQIGSVTASISNSVTIASLPAISGTVTANTFALQGTAVTTSNFTSTTASTVLAGYNATREVLTIFSEGPGTLFVSAGATCTTVQYQVRLSSGDYYEAPSHQSTITHSAVFATAGSTARVTEVS